METYLLTNFEGLDQSLVPGEDSKRTRDLDGVEVRRGRIISCRGITLLPVIVNDGGLQ